VTPVHSIIIPHRNREPYLRACLASLAHSAAVLDLVDEFEIVVVHAGLRLELPGATPWPPLRIVYEPREMPVFNKSALLNLGITASRGRILTFLDADAIVGPRFLETAMLTDWSAVHRVCYRVRYIEHEASRRIIDGLEAPDFAAFDRHRLAYEGWNHPNHRAEGQHAKGEPWGNSQFSIHRQRLGDLRYDEDYIGRGFEDLDLLARMHRAWGDAYRGLMITDAEHAIYHLTHGYANDWRTSERHNANNRRYRQVLTGRDPQ
jgi:glycosyltransferase involved in cell wall biosynthesis